MKMCGKKSLWFENWTFIYKQMGNIKNVYLSSINLREMMGRAGQRGPHSQGSQQQSVGRGSERFLATADRQQCHPDT